MASPKENGGGSASGSAGGSWTEVDRDEPASANSDSDFDIGKEDGSERDADSGSEDEGDTDDSEAVNQRKTRKRRAAAISRPPPPDTAMRRKLRVRAPVEEAAPSGSEPAPERRSSRRPAVRKEPEASTHEEPNLAADTDPSIRESGVISNNDEEEDGSEDGNEETGELPVLAREMTEEKIQEELREVQGMWEMATILEFMSKFRAQLDIQWNFSAEELERALVASIGNDGLIVDVHKGLLSVIMPRTDIPNEGWQKVLARHISKEWPLVGSEGDPPLSNGKGRNAAVDYAAMASSTRVLVLKALCDIILDYGDIAERIEESIRVSKLPPKQLENLLKNKPKRGSQPIDVLDDFRRQPLGVDSNGVAYWWLDLHDTTGSRLYKHTPGKRRGPKAKIIDPPGDWELVASSVDELQKVGEALSGSKKKADKQLLSELDTIIAQITARVEEEERKQRVRSRLRLDVGCIVDGTRSRRARQAVNYTFDAFDQMIGEALRESRRSARTRDRPAAAYTAVEEEEEEEPVPPPTKEERWARRSRHVMISKSEEWDEKRSDVQEPPTADATTSEAGKDGSEPAKATMTHRHRKSAAIRKIAENRAEEDLKPVASSKHPDLNDENRVLSESEAGDHQRTDSLAPAGGSQDLLSNSAQHEQEIASCPLTGTADVGDAPLNNPTELVERQTAEAQSVAA